MADFITDINSICVKKILPNESIAGLIQKRFKTQSSSSYIRTEIHNVTSLCNPIQAYWKHEMPKVPNSVALDLKFKQGNVLGRFASAWFKKLPDFYCDEATLDGKWVNIPGVRGRIDFRIGDSIVEFKTKPNIPTNIEDIFNLYPQDLEQLLFYAILHPMNPKVNYLVFMNDSAPHKLLAYKVVVDDFKAIKNLLINRIKSLEEAYRTKKPELLGKCRYYSTTCPYGQENICNCKNADSSSMEKVNSSIQIQFDNEFTEKLGRARKEVLIPNNIFTTYQIIAPRKMYMGSVLDIKNEYLKAENQEDYEVLIDENIRNLPNTLNNPKTKEILSRKLIDERIKIRPRWMLFKSSMLKKDKLVPFLVKTNMTTEHTRTLNRPPYNIAELAIASATYNIDQGVFIQYFPMMNNMIKVFDVHFKNLDLIQKQIIQRLDSMEQSIKSSDFSNLPECPTWMNRNDDCPMANECRKLKNNTCG